MLTRDIDDALREIVAARARLAVREAELVARARSCGATWVELGGSLGLSKQAARQRHLAIDPIFARRPRRAPTIAGYHAEMMAALRAEGRSVP